MNCKTAYVLSSKVALCRVVKMKNIYIKIILSVNNIFNQSIVEETRVKLSNKTVLNYISHIKSYNCTCNFSIFYNLDKTFIVLC